MRAVTDGRYAISEERSEASLGANAKGGAMYSRYLVPSTPYVALANTVSGRKYHILPSANFDSIV